MWEENKESGCQAELKGNRAPRVCNMKHTQSVHTRQQVQYTRSDKH